MKLSQLILESDETQLGAELAKAIEKELENKKPVQEALGVVGVISYILLSNTVAHMVSGIAKKIAKKQGWDKVEDKSKAIYDWTHKNEEAFMTPIKRVLSVVLVGKAKKYLDQNTQTIKNIT